MAAPNIYWKYSGSAAETSGTCVYANQEAGGATSFSGTFTVWNSGGADASNASLYYLDVVSNFCASQRMSVYWSQSGGAATSDVSLSHSELHAISTLPSSQASDGSFAQLRELVRIEAGDAVGTVRWSKNVQYQYS
jgi:hypothetical protein